MTTKGTYTIATNPTSYNMIQNFGVTTTAFTRIAISGSDTTVNSTGWNLPLPSSLDYGTQYNWSSGELGHVANSIMTAISTGNSDTKTASAMNTDSVNFDTARGMSTQSGMDSAGNVLSTLGKETMRKLITGASQLLTGGDTVAKEVFKQQGIAYNPNEQLYFDGVNLREFSMSFDIQPHSASESIDFAEAYLAIRRASAPSYDPDKFYFTYPSYFDVSVYIGDLCILQRKQCAIVSTNCNMTPNGALTWNTDKRPTAYTLDFTFKESIVATADVESSSCVLGV